MSSNRRDHLLEDAFYHMQTSDHPLWPAFKAWAKENIPGLHMMLDTYWRAFLAGAEASCGDAPTTQRGIEMTFEEFSAINRRRCESPQGFNHALASWSLSDWMTATTGELGEAANIAKKLNRVRDGVPGNKETPEELREGLQDEVADVFIYLDLLAQSQGFSLADAVRRKFNKTSAKIGSPILAPILSSEAAV